MVANPKVKEIILVLLKLCQSKFSDTIKCKTKAKENLYYWKKESIEYVVVKEMECYLGKRHFHCDKEHFWYAIKKQLFKVIDEASD